MDGSTCFEFCVCVCYLYLISRHMRPEMAEAPPLPKQRRWAFKHDHNPVHRPTQPVILGPPLSYSPVWVLFGLQNKSLETCVYGEGVPRTSTTTGLPTTERHRAAAIPAAPIRQPQGSGRAAPPGGKGKRRGLIGRERPSQGSGSATDNAEETDWSGGGQSQHATPTPRGGGVGAPRLRGQKSPTPPTPGGHQ